MVCPSSLRWDILAHAGESGVQLSDGVEMEAYSDQTAAANNLFC